jgi:hypothetical protein
MVRELDQVPLTSARPAMEEPNHHECPQCHSIARLWDRMELLFNNFVFTDFRHKQPGIEEVARAWLNCLQELTTKIKDSTTTGCGSGDPTWVQKQQDRLCYEVTRFHDHSAGIKLTPRLPNSQ